MAMNTLLNADDVKTALDEKFWSEFNEKPGPNWADVTDPMIFAQKSTRLAAETNDLQNDVGEWGERNEGETFDGTTINSGFKKTWSVANFGKELEIPREYMDDEQWDTVGEQVEKLAMKGKYTQRKTGFGVFRNGQTTFTTNSGVALFSASHTNLNSDTISNLLTGVASPAKVNEMIVALAQQKDQNGDIIGTEANCLLCCPAQFTYFCEVLDSELKADTADNNMNAFSSKYNIYIKQHSQLGAAAGGSDTAFYMLAKKHPVRRTVRQAIETRYVHWDISPKNLAYYRGDFREYYSAKSYEGINMCTGV